MTEQWPPLSQYPRADRMAKPRQSGLTMVIDKGLGLMATQDVVEMAGAYMDFYKFGFGTAALYPQEILVQKIAMLQEAGLHPYLGGTFLEVAEVQGKRAEFFRSAKAMGFGWVEVSDGTIPLTGREKIALVKEALDHGFSVLAEVGKKEQGYFQGVEGTLKEVQALLAAGASYIIMEGRESGKGVHFYDESGKIKEDVWSQVAAGLKAPERVIWEAPLKEQQAELIEAFGTNVNLGNIHPFEVVALEALRVGLRSDTLAPLVKAGQVS